VETGIIKRLPSGAFVEVHQPLAPPSTNGHGQLDYVGWTVPKKMNRLGALGPAIRGFFVKIEEPTPPSSTPPKGVETTVTPAEVEAPQAREEVGSGKH
jgi:ubiquinol-cytochrome c reductase cytochrome b subunit